MRGLELIMCKTRDGKGINMQPMFVSNLSCLGKLYLKFDALTFSTLCMVAIWSFLVKQIGHFYVCFLQFSQFFGKLLV